MARMIKCPKCNGKGTVTTGGWRSEYDSTWHEGDKKEQCTECWGKGKIEDPNEFRDKDQEAYWDNHYGNR